MTEYERLLKIQSGIIDMLDKNNNDTGYDVACYHILCVVNSNLKELRNSKR